ncbi:MULTISPECIES: hypothetical protein [unclassified Bradyrhizobium]|uniref:hypothetical protein n=1 Tax=unclassified Bradyrhizobium TaxID=2631580 RepID=UPI003398471B
MAEEETKIVPPVVSPVQEPATPEPAVVYTDGEPVTIADPNYGQGGAYIINPVTGIRVRV